MATKAKSSVGRNLNTAIPAPEIPAQTQGTGSARTEQVHPAQATTTNKPTPTPSVPKKK